MYARDIKIGKLSLLGERRNEREEGQRDASAEVSSIIFWSRNKCFICIGAYLKIGWYIRYKKRFFCSQMYFIYIIKKNLL